MLQLPPLCKLTNTLLSAAPAMTKTGRKFLAKEATRPRPDSGWQLPTQLAELP